MVVVMDLMVITEKNNLKDQAAPSKDPLRILMICSRLQDCVQVTKTLSIILFLFSYSYECELSPYDGIMFT